MPSRPDSKELAHRCHLTGRRQPTDLRDVDSDEIDQPLTYQRSPFMRVVEKLAHRDRRASLLTQMLEVADVFRRKRVFQKTMILPSFQHLKTAFTEKELPL